MTLRTRRIRHPKLAATSGESMVWRRRCLFDGKWHEAGTPVPEGLMPQHKLARMIDGGYIVPRSHVLEAEKAAPKPAAKGSSPAKKKATTKKATTKKAASKPRTVKRSPAQELAEKTNATIDELAELYDVEVEQLVKMTAAELAELVEETDG